MSNQIIISAEPDSFKQYFTSIWKHRKLIVILAKRDLKIKYAQTALGLTWSFLQPLTAIVIYSLFFRSVFHVDVGYPYPLFTVGGVLCWNLFNYIFSHGSTSLLSNQDLIRKLSFPKILLPMSKVLVGFVEAGLTLLIIIPMIVWMEVPITVNVFGLIPGLLFTALLGLGVSMVLAAATIRYRDLHHLIPFLVNFGIWFTPVFYPVSLIPEDYKNLIYLNPMASLIEIVRWALFGDHLNSIAVSGMLISVIVCAIGIIYFKRVEDDIAEIV